MDITSFHSIQLFCRKTWSTKNTAKGNGLLSQSKAFVLHTYPLKKKNYQWRLWRETMECILSGGLRKRGFFKWLGWLNLASHLATVTESLQRSVTQEIRVPSVRDENKSLADCLLLLCSHPVPASATVNLILEITPTCNYHYVFQLLKLLILNSVTQPLSPVFFFNIIRRGNILWCNQYLPYKQSLCHCSVWTWIPLWISETVTGK